MNIFESGSVDWSSCFQQGLDYKTYLQQHGSLIDQGKWQASFEATLLASEQLDLLKSFKRKMYLLCMSGAWCGDCVEHCPIFHRFESECSNLELRFIDRDANDELKSALTICGSSRVPQTVILSEDFLYVTRLGDRPLAKYRDIAARIQGAACSTGFVVADDPLRLAVIQNWLDEIERAQLVLRTSPSLRQRHND